MWHTKIAPRIDKKIMGAKSNHIQSTDLLIIPGDFFVPFFLIFSKITGYICTKKANITYTTTKI